MDPKVAVSGREGETAGVVSPRLRDSEASSSSLPDPSGLPNQGQVEPPGAEGSEYDVCVFPMVGKVDPRSNWVPAHFFRYLLSLLGGPIVACLDPYSVEVWRVRALGRTFRHGAAFAYERAVALQAIGGRRREVAFDLPHTQMPRDGPEVSQNAGDEDQEDLVIDQVRHVPPEEYEGPPIRAVQLYMEEESDSSSAEESYGTTASGMSTDSQSVERGESELADPSSATVGLSENPSRAVDGALIVIHLDCELGWSMEEAFFWYP